MLSFNYTPDYYPLFAFKPLTSSDSVSDNLQVTVFPIWYKKISLQWTVPSSWPVVGFHIYKSNNTDGPYVRLNEVIIASADYYKDNTTTQYSKFNKDYYIVEAVFSNGQRVQSLPSTWQNKRTAFAELRAREVQRREWLLLSKFTGIPSFVFQRKTYGQRCRVCWNFQLEKIMNDKCPDCAGTGFEGGYFDPRETLLQYDASPNDISLEYFGKWESNNLSAWTISLPETKARDLIYRVSDGSLYYVEDWFPTELQTRTVRQIFKLVQLDKESPEYSMITRFNLIPSNMQ